MKKNTENKVVYVSAIGAVPQLANQNKAEWNRFKDKIGFYFEANEIKDESRKKAILIGCTGDVVYDTLMKCKDPKVSIQEISLEESYKVLNDYFNPVFNKFLQLQMFGARRQQQGERILDYLSALRELAPGCEFQDNDEAILRQLVVGIKHRDLQRELLMEGNLTLTRVVEKSVASEQADLLLSQLQEIRSAATAAADKEKETETVHSMSDYKRCSACGYRHAPRSCPAFRKRCNTCTGKHHFSRCCRTKLDEIPVIQHMEADEKEIPAEMEKPAQQEPRKVHFSNLLHYTSEAETTDTTPTESSEPQKLLTGATVSGQQDKNQQSSQQHCTYVVGEKVWYRNFRTDGVQWVQGTVLKILNENRCTVKSNTGHSTKRLFVQMRKASVEPPVVTSTCNFMTARTSSLTKQSEDQSTPVRSTSEHQIKHQFTMSELKEILHGEKHQDQGGGGNICGEQQDKPSRKQLKN